MQKDGITAPTAASILSQKRIKVSSRTIQRRAMRSTENPLGMYAHVSPVSSSLSAAGEEKRLNYALHGSINNPVPICVGKLPGRWADRKKRIAFLDWKPFYNGVFHHRNVHRQYRAAGSTKPLTTRSKEKFMKK